MAACGRWRGTGPATTTGGFKSRYYDQVVGDVWNRI